MLSDRTFDFDQGRDAKISGSVSFFAWTSLKHSVHVSEQCKALLRVELEPNGMGIFLIVPYPALFGCFPMRTCGGIPVTSVPFPLLSLSYHWRFVGKNDCVLKMHFDPRLFSHSPLLIYRVCKKCLNSDSILLTYRTFPCFLWSERR